MKALRMALTALFVLGLFIGLSGLFRHQRSQQIAAADYADARTLALSPAQEDAPSPTDGESSAEEAAPAVDLSALRAVNSEVIGWIAIPDTALSYPLLQGTDNSYYLKHTWKGEESALGAIFLDHRSSAAFTDFNTIIYGHRMRNDTMFGVLKEYRAQSYWEAHPSLTVTDDLGTHCYQIFAAYEAPTDAALYLPGEKSPEQAETLLDYAAEHSVLSTGISPGADDRILTLVTCTGNGYAARWVVQCTLSDRP